MSDEHSILYEENEEVIEFKEFVERANLKYLKHQEDFMRFALNNEHNGHGGGCFDDMGVGKTIQVIGLLECNPLENTLILMPVALIEQWTRAIKQIAGIEPLVYHGVNKRKIDYHMLQTSFITITSYNTLVTELPNSRSPVVKDLFKTKWARVVCDEAHHLRNMNTRMHTAVMALKAELRWVFTGTPIQNSKDDFYGLCNVMGLKPSYYKNEANLKELARNYLIKRSKEDVGISLPELRVKTEMVRWENEKEKEVAAALHNNLNFSGVRLDESSEGVRNLPEMNNSHFAKLMRSRQVCILPEMVAESMPTIYDKEKLAYVTEGLSSCSKVNAVIKHITERKDNGRKKLMFCHFRDEMSKFEEELTRIGLKVAILDGRTPQKERERILTSKTIDVLILQVNTCCEGLNLQHYKEMYFVTLHWNPAVHDQAVGRCYRLGQTEEVDVFIFQMEGFDNEGTTKTIDTYVGEVQENKRILSSELDKLCKEKEPLVTSDTLPKLIEVKEEQSSTCSTSNPPL